MTERERNILKKIQYHEGRMAMAKSEDVRKSEKKKPLKTAKEKKQAKQEKKKAR